MEKEELKPEKENFKCASCGASVLPDEKKCSYCGSANKYYQPKEIKELKMDGKPEFNGKNFSDAVGGFLGGLILTDIFKGGKFKD